MNERLPDDFVLEEEEEEEDATTSITAPLISLSLSLSIEQKEQFLRDGILVVENVLSKYEVQKAMKGLNETLSRHGVNVDSLLTTTTSTSVDDDENENDDDKEVVVDDKEVVVVDIDEENVNSSARALQQLSTTNGSGGVLDIFYEDWKLDICQKENLFRITTQLWEATFATCKSNNSKNNNSNCCDDEEEETDNNESSSSSSSSSSSLWWSPYGSFDYSKGYMYIDRICYRLPTKIAGKLGEQINGDRKKKKSRSIQRSLTPHLDCCPDTFFDNNDTETTKTSTKKWRPIQCFVSLTDNLEADTGGFEAAKGFHKDFQQWSQTRVPTIVVQKKKDGSRTDTAIPAACVGEYTHMRPKEDRDVMDRVCHIPVPAGSAVFWDNRIPHSNAYKHHGTIPRAVVYCSFLPDVELNRCYVQNQLLNYKQNRPVKDQWNHINDDVVNDVDDVGDQQKKQHYNFTSLGRKLMGIDTWI
jgi:hypothetical protein